MATAFVLTDNTGDDTYLDQKEIDLRQQEQLSALVTQLQRLADDQVKRKSQVESRWLDDLRAFHGRYDETTEQELVGAKKSRAFIKITRKKTNSWNARLEALLFPTDDENWDIRATPVPTLHEVAKEAVKQAQAAVDQANQQAQQGDPNADQTAQQAQTMLDTAQAAQAEMDEASKRVERMRQEMRDQLIECDYASECRLAIRDACRLGTGILKGPLSGDQTRGTWMSIDGKYQYHREDDPAPIFKWVDPWSYFPDMSALRPEDREFEFERHLWSGKDLRRLVKERNFNATAVRELLEDGRSGRTVTDTSMNYLSSLRAITGASDAIKDRYVGWEYHGPLTCKEIAMVLRAMGQDDAAQQYEDDQDPLTEIRVICFFCEGKMLKMSPAYPLDSGESLYSIFTFEPSEASLFGYGVPHIMSDSQKAMNGAWRMALDNAALSVAPQIFIDRDSIEPANRDWSLTPRKIWYRRKGAGTQQGTVLEAVTIPNNVNEIMAIAEMARRFIDDETALPVQSEGEATDNPGISATATNVMSMATNITFRRVVKNFDDGITAPSIRRLYDWNMQFNSRDDIKGDMKTDARGSTALLQRELQSQMLLNIAQNWTANPLLGMAIKPYDVIVETLRAAMIQPETLMVTREQFEQAQAQAQQAQQEQAQQASQNDPTIIAANVRKEAAQIDADSRKEVAQMQHDTEMLKLAQHYDISVDKLETMLAREQMNIDHKERALAAEAAVEERRIKAVERTGQNIKGSGGSV